MGGARSDAEALIEAGTSSPVGCGNCGPHEPRPERSDPIHVVTSVPGINDEEWKCFANSKYNTETNEWEHKKVPYVDLVGAPTPA